MPRYTPHASSPVRGCLLSDAFPSRSLKPRPYRNLCPSSMGTMMALPVWTIVAPSMEDEHMDEARVNTLMTLLVKSWPSISEGHGTTFHQRHSLRRSGLHMSDARLIFRAFSTYPTESL